MLEQMPDQTVWDALKKSPHPVVLYGMGDGAEKIKAVLDERHIPVCGVFASDNYVRGHSFLGYPVKTYREICAAYPQFNIVVCFAVHDAPMLERLRRMSREHPLYAPDIPVAGGGLFTLDYVAAHEQAFDRAFSLMADGRSRQVYLDILRFKISGDTDYLFQATDPKALVYQELLKLSSEETMVDLGAYDGDTIREFLSYTKGQYRHIYAMEPDPKNFRKLAKKTQTMERITLLQGAAWDKKGILAFSSRAGRNSRIKKEGVPVPAVPVDDWIAEPVTFLKMDIEGSESRALAGAEKSIHRYRPKLYVCAYHRNEDLFSLPLQIHALCPDYRIFLRHSPYIPAWETNLYAICEK